MRDDRVISSTSRGQPSVPEGHVIHRLANAISTAFAGEPVEVTSPQGRFGESAAMLDGTVLTSAQAWGKHLVVDFDNNRADHLLHIHLGLIGKLGVGPLVPVAGQVRLRITDGVTSADLRGPQTCELINDDEWAAIAATIGPDPIRDGADPDIAWHKVRRSSRQISDLLLDQKIVAGVGNIYRAEVLFRHRIDPATPGKQISHSTWLALWNDLVMLMRAGVEAGRIDTVEPEHTPEAMGRAPRVDRHGGEVYVYRRENQPCLVCTSPVKMVTRGGRHLFWCPRCQRRHH
ncbi:Fpg/Nei family DNA glycosylase [Cutibacterium equinum]|uniref:DNA-(apurinic or apyrimidinic site) lyase n=2 Tax=Cutibacterium equinum TaxID=3016342 RepID=A0ABY7QX98_9ACTN|nr:DNA-formamidopyrimidine glycosylase family protein [Cutibacterium equinum]WCC79335.1 Fpg/Nei family DNA glycosylase [Cutibacterium equinum]